MTDAYAVKESCMIAWFETVPAWCNSDVTPQWAGWRRKVWHRAKKRLIWNQICKRKQLSWLLVTYRDTVYRIGQADPEQLMLPVLAQTLQENENWACANSSKSTKKMSFSQADLTAIAPMLTQLQPYLTSSSRNTQILANLMPSDPLFVRLNMFHINLQHGTVT